MVPPNQIELADGTTLRTTITGDGPPVVLCHGGPGLWDYLEPLAELLDDRFTVVRFDQRGCGRSTGTGPFTIAQAVDDLDQVRAAYGFDRWAVVGHSWGAELALRYAAHHGDSTTVVGYLSGIGAGDDYRLPYAAERERRLGPDLPRWTELGSHIRTPEEEHEWCVLQWRPDFSPGPAAAQHAEALWQTRPPGVQINNTANRELWADRATEDLLTLGEAVTCRVLMVCGADDPRPWRVTDPLFAALPNAQRVVLDDAGHATWAEQPAATRDLLLELLTDG
jgi:proline iminopeptidase